MPDGEVILYTTEDGEAAIQLRAVDGTVWLSQSDMAELFQTTKQNVSLHIRNVLAEGEMEAEATVKEYLTVRAEGNRQVSRSVTMAESAKKPDAFLSFNECDALTHAGLLRMHVPRTLAAERFEALDSQCCTPAALAADLADITVLPEIEETPKKGRKKGSEIG